MKIEEQKKQFVPVMIWMLSRRTLNTYGEEAKNLLEDLQSRNERMFLVTVLFLNTAKKRQEAGKCGISRLQASHRNITVH